MGVRGLLRFIERRRDNGAARRIDLGAEAKRTGTQLEVCFDLHGACTWLTKGRTAETPPVCLGDYEALDAALTFLVRSLVRVGIAPTFFVDTPSGAGLLDACCPFRGESCHKRNAEEAKLAHAASQWCCGAAASPPLTDMALPLMWLEQAAATLRRLETPLVLFGVNEQAPLWRPSFDAYAIVSDNVDWCLVPDWYLIPWSGFDLGGDLRTPTTRLMVSYTSCELLVGALRLSLPIEADFRGSTHCQPLKVPWRPEHALRELAQLCGTEDSTLVLKKHKVYKQIGVELGKEPVEQLAKWVRSKLFPIKAWRKDVQLEQLDNTIGMIARSDPELLFSLRFSRLVFTRDVAALAALGAEWATHRGVDPPQLPAPGASAPPNLVGPARSVALGAREVLLDALIEGGEQQSAWAMLTDLRRLTYSFMRSVVTEHCPSLGRITSQTLKLEQSMRGSLEALWFSWPAESRLRAFHRCMEHNLLSTSSGNEKSTAEDIAWSDAETCLVKPGVGYLRLLFQYIVSLNLRADGAQLVPHELDSILCIATISAGTEESLSPLAGGSPMVASRLEELRQKIEGVGKRVFQTSDGLKVPKRAARLAMIFQTTIQGLYDLARVLGLDRPGSGGPSADLKRRFEALVETPEVENSPTLRLLEPKAVFCSAPLFVSLFCAGACEGDLHLFGDNPVALEKAQPLLRELATLRSELLYLAQENGDWVGGFAAGLPDGMLKWPTASERQKEEEAQVVKEELPIDGYRESILHNIGSHRVTCIDGEPGCGKSTRVPLFLLESKGPPKGASGSFRVLCAQPHRVACIALARWLAGCLDEHVGETVGYKLPGEASVTDQTRIFFSTYSHLLNILTNDTAELRLYSHIVLDEVHERDLEADFLHLFLKLNMNDHTFRLIVMSATLQADLFQQYFLPGQSAPKPVSVSRRCHSVEIVHIEEVASRFGSAEKPLGEEALAALHMAVEAFGSSSVDAVPEKPDVEPSAAAPSAAEVDPEFADSDDDTSDAEKEEGTTEKGATPAKASAAPPEFAAKGFPGKGGKGKKSMGQQVPPQPPATAPPVKSVAPKCVAPVLAQGLGALVLELLQRTVKAGEAALVFLPGATEIVEFQDELTPLEKPTSSGAASLFQVLAFDPIDPIAEQDAIFFQPPPLGVSRVILTTGTATESSLMLPGVTVVVDFGLWRCLAYNPIRQMACLRTVWESRAMAKRRAGRVGRVRPGVVIRLFTKAFHEGTMLSHDVPEALVFPLERIYVEACALSTRIGSSCATAAPGAVPGKRHSPSELMRLMPEPHPDAVGSPACGARLEELGALAVSGEHPAVTILGSLVSALPLDVRLCRLVLFGCLFGVPCDAIAMAAGLSVQDPFTIPSHLVMKSRTEYTEAVRRSFASRWKCDGGHLSEPIALRTLLISWIQGFDTSLYEGPNGHAWRGFVRAASYRRSRALSQSLAVSARRCSHFVAAVADVAARLKPFLPKESAQLRQVAALLGLLRPTAPHGAPQDAEAPGLPLPCVEDLFCREPWRLKAMLTCAFAPQFMCGQVRVRQGEQGWPEQTLGSMLRQGVDPKRAVVLGLEGLPSRSPAVANGLLQTLQTVTDDPSLRLSPLEDGNAIAVSVDPDVDTAASGEGANGDVVNSPCKPATWGGGEAASPDPAAPRPKSVPWGGGGLPDPDAPKPKFGGGALQAARWKEGGRPLNGHGIAGNSNGTTGFALLDEEQTVTPLPEACYHLDCLGAGRLKFLANLPQGMRPELVTLSKPKSPYEIIWNVMGPERERKSGSKGAGKDSRKRPKLIHGVCYWRTPLGLLASCGVDDSKMPPQGWGPDALPIPETVKAYAVYASESAASASSAAAVARVIGTTILGSEADNLVAVALIIAFIRHHQQLEFKVDPDSCTVEAVRLLGTAEVSLRDHGQKAVLLVEDIQRINEVRKAISDAFQVMQYSSSANSSGGVGAEVQGSAEGGAMGSTVAPDESANGSEAFPGAKGGEASPDESAKSPRWEGPERWSSECPERRGLAVSLAVEAPQIDANGDVEIALDALRAELLLPGRVSRRPEEVKRWDIVRMHSEQDDGFRFLWPLKDLADMLQHYQAKATHSSQLADELMVAMPKQVPPRWAAPRPPATAPPPPTTAMQLSAKGAPVPLPKALVAKALVAKGLAKGGPKGQAKGAEFFEAAPRKGSLGGGALEAAAGGTDAASPVKQAAEDEGEAWSGESSPKRRRLVAAAVDEHGVEPMGTPEDRMDDDNSWEQWDAEDQDMADADAWGQWASEPNETFAEASGEIEEEEDEDDTWGDWAPQSDDGPMPPPGPPPKATTKGGGKEDNVLIPTAKTPPPKAQARPLGPGRAKGKGRSGKRS